MAAIPVAALVAETDIAEAVVNAAVVADVPAPVAPIKPVMAAPEAPVAGGPECALIGCLNPCAGHPIVACWCPCPIAGRPQITVAGIRWLLVFGQLRRRLGCIRNRLRHAVSRVL